MRQFLAALAALMSIGCTVQSKMASVDIPDAFVEPIEKTVAVYYSDEFQASELRVSDDSMGESFADTRVFSVGKISMDMFNQVLGDTFSNVIQLESLEGADLLDAEITGIFVPQIVQSNSKLWVPSPRLIPGWAIDIEIEYEVVFLSRDGQPIIRWDRAFEKHQDKKFGSFETQAEKLIAELMRDAGSAFIVAFSSDLQDLISTKQRFDERRSVASQTLSR